MGVRAHDHRRAVVDRQLRKGALFLGRIVNILGAPVEERDDDVASGQLALDIFDNEPVNQRVRARAICLGAIPLIADPVVAKERIGDAADLGQRRLPRFLDGVAHAKVQDSRLVEDIGRVIHTDDAEVERVIVRSVEDVDLGELQSGNSAGISLELKC